ncbi:MAG: YafY family transcriptional regulator [Bacillus sp. (in: Bacteria)]|nr:YafY family transcriptional regulator [Bacillus sp. (in: firmicutes)]MCM1426340.1 YafY family transcriptional regulator [Eubacterium sp.]
MKVDRILEIIIYLINHDNVPASYLAERFHVSVRTIQRDMVSISSIGIPVYAESGKYGGYSILPIYKIKNSDIRNDEQQMIIKALESLATSYTSDTLKALIEKYNAIIEKEGGQKVFWDFGVTRENNHVQNMNQMLEQAIVKRKHVAFHYRNADGKESKQYIEPLAIHYKWYAWYLFSYSPEKKQYRTFKTARIQDLHITDTVSVMEHGDIEKLMKDSEQKYYQTCIHIEVQFDNEHTNLMAEYFPDCPAEKLTETVSRIFIDVPAKERLWKALLLSFGDKVKIIEPEEYKTELIETAKKFLSNYDI